MQSSSILTITKTIISDGLQSSGVFLGNNLWLIVIIYIIILISLIVRLHYSHKTMISADRAFNAKLDPLRYTCSSILYNEKNNIHDINNTLPLLLHNKSSAMKEHKPYRSVTQKLIDEIEYISNLTGKPISIDKSGLLTNAAFCSKIHHTTHNIKQTLAFMTLGLSKLFIA